MVEILLDTRCSQGGDHRSWWNQVPWTVGLAEPEWRPQETGRWPGRTTELGGDHRGGSSSRHEIGGG